MREYDPLLDSSNMSTENWIKIATDVGVSTEDDFIIEILLLTFIEWVR